MQINNSCLKIKKAKKAYTLLEVMLSMAILSIVVYSIFLVFDNTMEVMDEMFIDTHRFEQVRQFFDRLSTELSTMTVGESSGTPHYLHGGPHWIEFSTPLIKASDSSTDLDEIMSEYIRSSSQGLTKQYSRVMYYTARPSNNNYNGISGFYSDLFTHHVFRLLQVGSSRADLLSGINEVNNSVIAGDIEDEVPLWLDDLGTIKIAKSSKAASLAGKVNISEALSCRAMKFRYHYKVKGDDGNTYNYIQDWWDSRLKYPSYNTSGTGQVLIDYVESAELYKYYRPIAKERERRYFYPEKNSSDETRTDPDGWKFSFNESWLYEGEVDELFVPFGSKVLPDSPSYTFADLKPSDLSPEFDPWFQRSPEVIEVTVYLLDRKMSTLPPRKRIYEGERKCDDFTNYEGSSPDNDFQNLAQEFRGEVYSMKIYIRTSASSVTHFNRDILTE